MDFYVCNKHMNLNIIVAMHLLGWFGCMRQEKTFLNDAIRCVLEYI